MKTKTITFLSLFLLSAAIMASDTDAVPSLETTTEEARTAGEGEHGLLETLRGSGYTVFAELLELSGVADELEEGQPFTCFAPENKAFNMEVVERIKRTPKDEELMELMRYHIIQGDFPKEVILISRREPTLGGKFLLFWITKGEISINNHSKLIEADIKTKGGVIHGISKILRTDVEGALP